MLRVCRQFFFLRQDNFIGNNNRLTSSYGLWWTNGSGDHATSSEWDTIATVVACIDWCTRLASRCTAWSHRSWCSNLRRNCTVWREARWQMPKASFVLPDFKFYITFLKAFAASKPCGGQHNWHARDGSIDPRRPWLLILFVCHFGISAFTRSKFKLSK